VEGRTLCDYTGPGMTLAETRLFVRRYMRQVLRDRPDIAEWRAGLALWNSFATAWGICPVVESGE
jgi:hypothetical protein